MLQKRGVFPTKVFDIEKERGRKKPIGSEWGSIVALFFLSFFLRRHKLQYADRRYSVSLDDFNKANSTNKS